MKIVLGLGNPGAKYATTRHNLGFMIVDRIAADHDVVVADKRSRSLVGRWNRGGEDVLLVKPQTLMNDSGLAVEGFLRDCPLSGHDMIVVHDDLDLSFGAIRVRAKGRAAGHRGLLSIIECLGQDRFFRVRVGIGRPPAGVDPSDFVLTPFTSKEAGELDEVVSRGAGAVACLLSDGPQRAMERFNRAKPAESPL